MGVTGLTNDWKERLQKEFEKPYFRQLTKFVENEYRTHTCYPPKNEIFAAFNHCPFHQVQVVILGQDPYHGPMQANGLCFSVHKGVPVPPSLKNIFKEIKGSLNIPPPKTGDLTRWAEQGVLLLNATLTVRCTKAGSHQKKGWETFTDAVIKMISREKENVVFLLWGAYAQKKGEVIDRKYHRVLEAVHPSPLSAHRGFIGCKHFVKANEFLESKGLEPIQW